MKTKCLILGWYQDFECPGGDCGLTCCSREWKIKVRKDEIEKYKGLSHEFRDRLLEAIDEENGQMKCSGEVCDLLNSEGYCELVLNCGSKYLSDTCRLFPRLMRIYGDVVELVVEIVCPLVAVKLLDTSEVDFSFDEIEFEQAECSIDYKLYDGLSRARTLLIEAMQLSPGNFTYGKMFLVYKVHSLMKELMKRHMVDIANVQQEIGNYFVQDQIAGIFSKCEVFGQSTEAKTTIIFNALCYIKTGGMLEHLIGLAYSKYPQVVDQIEEWLSSENQLAEDLARYIQYVRKEYPVFVEKYFIYELFSFWIQFQIDDFESKFMTKNLEFMLIQICGMALWKQQGTLDKNQFAVLIAAVDRRFSHSSQVGKLLAEIYEKLPGDGITNLLLMLIA